MKHIKAILLAVCTIIVLILLTPFIAYKLTDDIDIAVSPTTSRIVQYGDEYYYSTPRGVYRCGENDTLIAEGSYDSFYVDQSRLYCSDVVLKDKVRHNTLYIFDKNSGNALVTLETPDGLEGTIQEGIMCVQSVQKVTDKSVLRFYDIFNGFKEIPVIYERKFAGDATIFDFEDGRKPVVVSDSIYSEILSVTDDYIACTRPIDDTDIVFDYPNLLAYNITHVGKLNTSFDTEDGLYISTTENKSFFWEDKDFSRTDLKHNKYDSAKVIEQRTGRITEKKKFHRTERILHYDDKYTITYYNGKFVYYNSDNFREIASLPADEIVDGGKYTVENCGDMTFIFDENGLVRKLSALN
ncbi:MAG: hypothetical protein MJ100_02535 [Ruminococcus sp.]|nr:hypothetical protein [Ruminococcus sp.]